MESGEAEVLPNCVGTLGQSLVTWVVRCDPVPSFPRAQQEE